MQRLIKPSVLGLLLVVGTALFAFGQDDWGRTLNQPSADGAYYYSYLPSLFLDGDLDFTNQYAVTKNWYKTGTAPSGKPGNFFGIGPAIYQSPFWLLGHGLAIATGDRRDGFSSWEYGLVLWSSILFTLAALFLAMRIVERRVGGLAAVVAGPVAALLAGPVCYYAIRQPGYAHPFATFAAALLIERWDASYDDSPRSVRTWIVLGACFGAAVLARPQLMLWGIVLLGAALDDWKRRGELPLSQLATRWTIAIVVSVAVFLPQMFAWNAIYGEWWTVPQGQGFMRWDSPAWLETLFSSRNGLFSWSPLYVPMLLGLILLRHQHIRLLFVGVVGIALQAVANGAAWDWWAGGSFGGRRFDSAFPIFAVGCAALVAATVNFIRRREGRYFRTKVGVVVATYALALSALTGHVLLTLRTSVTSARINGGVPPSDVYMGKVGGVSGRATAFVSAVVMLPVRAVFAIREDVALDDYDRLVGVHHLGETFPGLNSLADKRSDRIVYKTVRSPLLQGLARKTDESAEMIGTRARIFVGLNRNDDLNVAFTVTAHGPITISWDGGTLIGKAVDGNDRISFSVSRPGRGVHWLDIEAPKGTVLGPIDLAAN